MQKRPITIALTLAGVIAGTTAGIAAISESVAPAVTTAAQPAPEMEVKAPADVQAVVPSDTTATTSETATPAVVVDAQVPAQDTPRAAMTQTPKATADAKGDERMVRIPFTNRYVRVTNPTFPSSAVEYAEPLPATIAYFEQRDRNRVLAGARGEIFPSAGLESPSMLPGTVAYFEQIETRRVAATQPAPLAEVRTAPPVAAAAQTPPGEAQQSALASAHGSAGN